MKVRWFLVVMAVLFALTACIEIQTSRRTYEKVLSEAVKEKVSFVGGKAGFVLPVPLMRDTFFMANGKQVREYLGKREWTIVYRYLPSCGSEACIPLSFFLEKVNEKKLDYLVVLRDITGDDYVLAANKIPIVGMDYEHYQEDDCDDSFVKDLMADAKRWEAYDAEIFFLFHRDTLVASGNQLDSLLMRIP